MILGFHHRYKRGNERLNQFEAGFFEKEWRLGRALSTWWLCAVRSPGTEFDARDGTEGVSEVGESPHETNVEKPGISSPGSTTRPGRCLGLVREKGRIEMRVRQLGGIATIFLGLGAVTARLEAQTAGEPQFEETLPGFKSGNLLEAHGIDNINLFSGDPGIAIPIGPKYQLSATYSWQLSAHFSSKFWGLYQSSCNPALSGIEQRASITGFPTLGVGWTLGVGYVSERGIYHSPDGGSHGSVSTNPSSLIGGLSDGETSMTTDDGSRLRITRTTTSDTPTTSYTVEFPDGSQMVFGQYFVSATPITGGTASNGFPTPEFENEDPSLMEVPVSSRKPARFWGLTEIDDAFGSKVLTVSYVGAEGSATAWQVDSITLFPNTTAPMTIDFTWGSVIVNDGNNGNPQWPVLKSISFPVTASQTLTATFSSSPHSFARHLFDLGMISNAYCPSPITSTAPALDSITLTGGGITGTYRYSFTNDFTNANTYLRGMVTRITLPTGGAISYVYGGVTGGGAGICAGLISPAGLCADPESGVGSNGTNSPGGSALSGPSPGGKTALQAYLDGSAAVNKRTDSDGTTTYDRYTYLPVDPDNPGSPESNSTVRRVLVTRPDGNGSTLVTKYLLHVVDPGMGFSPQDGGREIERRYYSAGQVGTETPFRVVISCLSGDYLGAVTLPNTLDSQVCGYRAASSFQTYQFVGNVRQKSSVTWYGVNPTTADGGGSCTDATTPCSSTSSTQYTYPPNASVPNSTNVAAAGHYRISTSSGAHLPSNSGGIVRTTTTDWTPATSSWLVDLYDNRSLSDSGTVVAAPASISTAFTFDTSNGFLTRETKSDASGTLTIAYSNDGLGNPIAVSRQGSGTGLTSTNFIDGLSFQNGIPISQQRSGMAWKSFDATRDPATGQIVSSRDPNSLQTTYSWDALGRLKTIDPPGSPSSSPPGEASTFVCYDTPTMTTTYRIVTDPGCANDASASAAFLSWERYTYDGLGRLAREIRQLPGSFAVRLHTYDAAGHEGFVSEWTACSSVATCATMSPSAGTRSSNYDPLDRPRTVTKADGTCSWFDRTDGSIAYSDTYEKSAAFPSASCTGTVFPTTAAVAGPTFTRKDVLGRVISVQEASASDLVNGTATVEAPLTSYSYDVLDKVAQVTQGSQVRKFTYDVFGFLRTEQNPEKGAAGNGTTNYGPYDALGDVLSETDNGISYTSTYDAAGRLKTLATNENSSTTYLTNTYDANFSSVSPYNYSRGRLTTRVAGNSGIAGASVADTFTYGTAGTGQLSSQKTQISPGVTATQSWTYNANGLIATHGHPRSSGTFPVSFTYSLGLPTAISANGTSVASAIGYNPAGVLKSWTDGKGVTTTISPNVIPTRPASISTSDAGFNTQTYGYDAAGNVVSIGSDVFKYDARTRLVSAVYAGQPAACADSLGNASRGQCFSYDRFGNLMAVSGNGSRTLTTSAATNRLTAGTGTSYDARGNLTFYSGETLTWDGINRQVRDQSSGADWKYLYDGANERIARVPASGTAFYTFRDNGAHVVTEYAGTSLGRDNVFLGNLLVASYASSALSGAVGWTYYHSDHLGTPRYITGVEGPFLPKYWPYGDEVSVNTTSQKLRFATMERDPENKHFYDHARSHDAENGRFVSADHLSGSIGHALSWNRYVYAQSNPLAFVDVNGDAISGSGVTGNVAVANEAISLLERVNSVASSILRTDQVREAFTGWSRYSPSEKLAATAVAVLAAADAATFFMSPEEGAPKWLLKLPPEVAENFAGKIHRAVLRSETTVFRYSGGVSDDVGHWFTTKTSLRLTKGIDPKVALKLPAGATAEKLNMFVLPVGSEVFVGRVADGSAKATQVYLYDLSTIVK